MKFNLNRGCALSAVYDAQDRLVRNRDWNFTYNARGYLASKASRSSVLVVNYVYDNIGQLRTVTDNAGLSLSYIYDAQGRQIGKIKNGSLVRALTFRDQLRPAAEFNPNGSLKSVFVYGSRGHVPEYMERGGVLYRFVTDHLGSVRLVVNLSTKQVAQSISYDSWGKVLNDTNPGFQPFGYAGGIYDHDTGLVRFGARDYDGRIGRWLDKDPIRFAGGMNFYVYVSNDPINYIDANGKEVGDWWDLPSNLSRAREIAAEELAKRPNGHNDLTDAERHANWSFRMKNEINDVTAWIAGTGHEIEGLIAGQPFEEMIMDLHNNGVGRMSVDKINTEDLWTLPLDKNSRYNELCGK